MAEGALRFDVASLVEDVLQQQGKRLSDVDLASRKAEEASLRRYEASGWLRKMVGVVGGRDLPAQPSEEEFRLGLRSGIVLCNALNKVQPGAVPKVVEAPSVSVVIPDGAALSAFQYFENVRNFLDSIEGMGIPAFEASDLEQGGKSSRIVNCILGLKSYNDWKEGGGKGIWKFSGNTKPSSSGKQFFRKNSDLFINSLSRNSSTRDSLSNEQNSRVDFGQDLNEAGSSPSLHILVHELLSDKNREEIPMIVENMLSRVMEEFEQRLANQDSQARTASRGMADKLEEVESNIRSCSQNGHYESKEEAPKRRGLVGNIQELKNTLHSTKEDMQMLCLKYQEEVNSLGKHLSSLAHAASGYQKVLEENRKLYNQVQDLKGNIRVYCRIRPFLPGQQNAMSTVEGIDESTLMILTPSKYAKGKKSFTFNKVFGPSASQEEVFSDMQPLVRSVLDGYNVCIFAYGQTGSGKTYTMTGPKDLTSQSLGVNYRALSDLFEISEQRKDSIAYDISVQMIEIYNEQVRDLLVSDGLNKRLEIRNNSSNGVNVPSANLVPVASTSDVISLMNIGLKNRSVGSTAMNDRSSRSHSCLTIHVQGRDLTSGSIIRGCMHLVDLAGSERADKSEAVGDRLKEAQHINRSLSALGDVISSLAQKNSHVPYRNSKLTQLLQDSLGGQAKTLMFVHISPEPDALGETISTLKFADRVSTVELGAAKANKESADIKELKEQIATLKAALTRKDRGESIGSADRMLTRSSSAFFPSQGSTRDISKAEELIDSSNWPPFNSPRSVDEEKCSSGDWVDKVMVKKHCDNSLGKWDEEDRRLSDIRRHSLDNDSVRSHCDESDDIEAETSDSSELDYQLWQTNGVPRPNGTPNGVGSKLRKPSTKKTKIPETRSLIPQPPTRRVANGTHSQLYKHVRQPASVDGKRRSTGGK